MKTKKTIKKLVLSKHTVSDLNGSEMKAVYGGTSVESRQYTNCVDCFITRGSSCCY